MQNEKLEGNNTNLEEKKESIVDRVMNGIINDIIEGNLNPGDRLPTEPELSEKYDAGRNSVREAIKQLQAYGVVYIKRADGTYISEEYNHKMLDPMLYNLILQKKSWTDFVQLRAVIDVGALHQVIHHSADTSNIVKELTDIIDRMDEEIHKDKPSVEAILEYDMDFHSRIVNITDNPLIDTITEYVTRLTIPSRRDTVKIVLESDHLDHFIGLHRSIIDLIKDKNLNDIDKTVMEHYVYWNRSVN